MHLKRLYIRESYEDFFKIISMNRKLKEPDRLHRMAITGTPGIGKSVFLILFYGGWLIRKKRRRWFYRRRMDGELAYVFQNDGCWETSNISSLLEILLISRILGILWILLSLHRKNGRQLQF